jgi:hypothetical protein
LTLNFEPRAVRLRPLGLLDDVGYVPDLLELGQLGGIAVLLMLPGLDGCAKLRGKLIGPKEIKEGGGDQPEEDQENDQV